MYASELPMRVMVTGSAGFIGYHLCQRLLQDGHEVVGVDDLSGGMRSNVDLLEQHAGFAFIVHDITTPLADVGHVDRIYNLACPASPTDFGHRPLEILEVCSLGVMNVMELARRTKARLLQASTSEVYGDPEEHPQKESYWGRVNPIGPRSCYDEGKRFAEALLAAEQRRDGVAIRVARIFNTYGPNMRTDDGRMLPTFVVQALRDAPLTVHGDGTQTRSFCHVRDLVDGLVRLMDSDVTGPVNLGNPIEIRVLDAAREILSITGSSSRIEFLPRPQDDPSIRRPDITRARERLGWEPRTEWTAGFRETIAWFREQMPTSG